MKTSHIFWGIFFLSIGGLLLAGNFTQLDFTWDAAWKFWPLVLVLIGVSILVKNQIGKNIVGGLAGLILAITLYASFSATTNLFHNNLNFVFDDEYNSDYDTTYFSQEYNDSIKTATLNFNGGAGSFKMLMPTDKLAEFKTEGYEGNYNLKANDIGSHSDIIFNMKNTKIKFGENNHHNSVEISLIGSLWYLLLYQ